MKIKYISTENIDPDEIIKIDPANSLIICSDLNEKNMTITPGGELSYVTLKNINLSGKKITQCKDCIYEFSPQFQISYPIGTHLIFDYPEYKNYVSKFYIDYDTVYSKHNVILTKIKVTLFIDVLRLSEITKMINITEGMSLFKMRLIPQINLMTGRFGEVSKIYIIKDQETGRQFIDLFSTGRLNNEKQGET